MIILLLCWFYISITCIVWGYSFLYPLEKRYNSLSTIEIPIVFLIGFSIIGLLSYFLTLFHKIDIVAHLVICAPPWIYLLIKKRIQETFQRVLQFFQNLSYQGIVVAILSLLLIAIINATTIIHPDTLIYHTQSIKWIELYPTIPGIAHLGKELGLQSMAFSIHALFRFNFISPNNLIIANGCFVFWFVLFLVNKIFSAPLSNRKAGITGFILLLTVTSLSFTDTRLTASSASPDFLVAVYLMAIAYIFITKYEEAYLPVIILLITAVISIKISALPILLLAILSLIKLLKAKNYKIALIGFGMMLFAGGIQATKNYISTGYILYPSEFADIFHPDWKLPIENISHFKNYIRNYARIGEELNGNYSNTSLNSHFGWIPTWWKQRYFIEKIILLTTLLSIIRSIQLLLQNKINTREKIIIIVCVASLINWFIAAPSVRFASGYMYIISAITLHRFYNAEILYQQYIKPAFFILFSTVLFGYGAYRLIKFTKPNELLKPSGIANSAYKKVNINNQLFYIVDQNCGFNPVPCTRLNLENIQYRTGDIKDGFKAVK
jgi:hypothetical protein